MDNDAIKVGEVLQIKDGIPHYAEWQGVAVLVIAKNVCATDTITVRRVSDGMIGSVNSDELEPVTTDVAAYIAKIRSLNEYGVSAMRTKAPHNDLTCAALGLAGESAEAMRAVIAMSISAGQFADMTKKHVHHKHPLEKEKAIKELGDVLWYLALAADVLGVTLEEVAQTNITKLAARFPDGFTVAASHHNG